MIDNKIYVGVWVCVCGKRREWHIVKADNDQFFFCSWMTLKKCYIVLSKVLQYISIYLRWHGISCINNFHWYQVHLHNKSENILFYSDFTGFCVHSQPALHTHHSNHFYRIFSNFFLLFSNECWTINANIVGQCNKCVNDVIHMQS